MHGVLFSPVSGIRNPPLPPVAVAQSVERVTPGEEVLVSISVVAARSLLFWSVFDQYNVTD